MSEVPAYVARAAEQHDLGSLVIWRKGPNPVARFITYALMAALGSALLYAVVWVLSRLIDQLRASLGALLVLAIVAIVAAAVLGVRELLKGFSAHYLYERGAIQTRNRRLSVATWDQLDEIADRKYLVGVLAENILYVRFFDGRRWEVETNTHVNDDLDKRLVEAFLDIARRLGRPIVHLPRDAKDDDVPPRGLIVLVVLAGFVVTFVINHFLLDAGLDAGLALASGFLAVGLPTWVVGQAWRFYQVVGGFFTVVGGLILIWEARDLLPSVNGWVVAAGAFAVEVLIVRLLLRVNAAVMPILGAARRRLYALTHGWRYRRRQEIAVPSRATAGRLLSVPPSAATTTGRSVVTFTINGQQVTVFDRVRRRPRTEDRPQTVWQVQLPAPATFREYPDGSWVDGSTLWYAQENLTRTGASPRRIKAVAARLVGAVVAPTTSQR
jgi:hypothetical protein